MYFARAYGFTWMDYSFDRLVRRIDAYGEKHGLRAVSIVAYHTEAETCC